MMKSRNDLFVLLSLTLTGVPALAVDYVACREMLRTKNEFIMLVNKEDEEIEKDIAWNIRDKDEPLIKTLQSYGVIDKSFASIDKRKRREKYYKKALKVEADMKRANCPY